MAPVDRPNVLWIFCDELRRDAVGSYGNHYVEIQTPHIDGIGAGGVVFDDYFVNSPVCVPSRMSMLTARSPEQTGVYGNEAADEGYPVPPDTVTFPQVFADHGYRTANFGKEHIPKRIRPWATHDPTGSGMQDLIKASKPYGPSLIRSPGVPRVVGGVFPEDCAFPPAQITQHVIRALDAADDRPFLLRASYLQPHTPILVPEPWAARYPTAAFPERPTRHHGLSEFEQRLGVINRGDGDGVDDAMAPRDFQQAQANYFGLVSWIDDQVGQLLSALDSRGLRKSTIILFTTDHGSYLGEDGNFGKHTFAPQNQRVPLMIRWPGTVEDGGRRTDMSQGLDVARTLFGLCGIPSPPGFGGRDLFGGEDAPAHVFGSIGYGSPSSLAFPNFGVGTYLGGRGWPRRSCVRTDRFRLDLNTRVDGRAVAPEDEDVFLVDRSTDPLEVENRSSDAEYDDVRTELRRILIDHTQGAVEAPDTAVYGPGRTQGWKGKMGRALARVSTSSD